jgi:hypothetical protein
MPKVVWLLVLGLLCTGIPAGIYLGRQPTTAANTLPPRPATVRQPEETPGTTPDNTPTTPVAGAENSNTPDMVFSVGGSATRRHDRTGSATNGSSTGHEAPSGLTAQQQRQAQLERMMGVGAGGPPPPSNNLPPLRNQLPSLNNVANTQNGSNPTPVRISDTARQRDAERVVESSGVIRQCWSQFKLRNPAATRRSLSIGISVADTGRVTLHVHDHSDPALASCIENRSGSVRALAAGSVISTATRADLE